MKYINLFWAPEKMAEVIKDWDNFKIVAPPLAGALLVKGLRRGRPVSAGEVLARRQSKIFGDIHAPVAGVITEISPTEIVIRRDSAAVGEPPRPVDLSGLSRTGLSRVLKELGLDLPEFLPGAPVIVSTFNSEPGLTFAQALLNEHRETLGAGLVAVLALNPGARVIWAVDRPGQTPAGVEECILKRRNYPKTLPALVKKEIMGNYDPAGRGVLGLRDLHTLGRIFRTGLPLTHLVLTLGGANYFVPVGARVIDLLTFANLLPGPGDAVVVGGLIRGRTLARLEQGLGKNIEGLHLVRAPAGSRPPAPCRRCGNCARACPVGLPLSLFVHREPVAWLGLINQARSEWLGCLGCGACALACPVGRPLLALSRLLRT